MVLIRVAPEPDVEQSKFCLSCAYISQLFILFSSCALLSTEGHPPYRVFQRTICSVVLSLAVFPSRKGFLQDLLQQCPFYCNGKILLRSEGERVHFSFFPLLSEKWKE